MPPNIVNAMSDERLASKRIIKLAEHERFIPILCCIELCGAKLSVNESQNPLEISFISFEWCLVVAYDIEASLREAQRARASYSRPLLGVQPYFH